MSSSLYGGVRKTVVLVFPDVALTLLDFDVDGRKMRAYDRDGTICDVNPIHRRWIRR